MAQNVSLKIGDLTDIVQTRDILKKLAQDDKISRYGMQRLIKLHSKLTAQAFEQKRDPDSGRKWAEPAAKTKADKRFKGLLTRSGALMAAALEASASAQPQSDKGRITATIKFPDQPRYAPYQQYGTAHVSNVKGVFMNKKTKHIETVYGVSTSTPARPFFAFASDFTNGGVNEEVGKILKVVFEAYRNSIYSKAIKLPTADVDGYTSVISFTNSGGSHGHRTAGMGHIVEAHGPNGQVKLVKHGMRDHLASGEFGKGSGYSFEKKRTERMQPPPPKPKYGTTGRPGTPGSRYYKLKEKHAKFQELKEGLRKEAEMYRQEDLTNLEKTVRETFQELNSNFNKSLQDVIANKERDKRPLKVRLEEIVNHARANGLVFVEGKVHEEKSIKKIRRQEEQFLSNESESLYLSGDELARKQEERFRQEHIETTTEEFRRAAGFSKGGRPHLTEAQRRERAEKAAADKAKRRREREEAKAKFKEELQGYREGRAVPINGQMIQRLYQSALTEKQVQGYVTAARQELGRKRKIEFTDALARHEDAAILASKRLRAREEARLERIRKEKERLQAQEEAQTRNVDSERRNRPKRKSKAPADRPQKIEDKAAKSARAHNAPIIKEIGQLKSQRQFLKEAGMLTNEVAKDFDTKIATAQSRLKQFTTKTVAPDSRSTRPNKTVPAAPKIAKMNSAQQERVEAYQKQVNRIKGVRQKVTERARNLKYQAKQRIRDTKDPFAGAKLNRRAEQLLDLRDRLDQKLQGVQQEFLDLKAKSSSVKATPSPNKPRGVRTNITTNPRNKD